ncbi:MAG: Ig-like domain-containing protein [Clostridia bacterium]|nr:Ig-like domain-containing protein [Clostridia bacterium]
MAASIPPESVSISFPQTVLQLGESYRLNAVLNPSTAITNFTWTSSNPSVVRVSDGTMTAIGTGTARIEVRTENGCVSQKSFAVIDANAPEEVAYARALSLLEAGENPMDEPVLVDLLRNALIQDNVPETQVSTLLAALLTAPETYRNIYLESFFEYSRNGSANVTTGISFYSLTRNTLFMSRTEAISQYMYTFFHESAHAADYNAAVGEERRYWSQLQVTLDALKADVASYLREQAFAIGLEDNLAIRLITRLLTPFADVSQEKLTASEEDAFQQLIYVCQDALWILPRRNSMMVQDMIGAMTNNAIDTGYGHYSSTSSYWFDEDTGLPTGMQAAEAWAEFFSAQITSDSAAISANEGILPRTCRVFAEVVAPAIETIFRSAILKLASAF